MYIKYLFCIYLKTLTLNSLIPGRHLCTEFQVLAKITAVSVLMVLSKLKCLLYAVQYIVMCAVHIYIQLKQHTVHLSINTDS